MRGSRGGGGPGSITRPGETDIFVINVENGNVRSFPNFRLMNDFLLPRPKVVRRIELSEVIPDKAKSKCRFIAYRGQKLYVVDLGNVAEKIYFYVG